MEKYEVIFLNMSMLLAILSSLLIIYHKKILDGVILSALFSVVLVLNYVFLDAPDVALTEAAVGGCLTGIFVFIVIKIAKNYDTTDNSSRISYIGLLVTIPLGLLLCYAITIDFVPFGDGSAVVHSRAAQYYIENTYTEIGIPNIVSAVLASYRGFDTLGETLVVFIAGIGVLVLLRDKDTLSPKPGKNLAFELSPIIRVTSNFVVPIIMLLGFYMLIHGEESPGGGFQAGAIIASAIVIYALNFGTKYLNSLISLSVYLRTAALGTMLYVMTGVVSILCGGQYLEYAALVPNHPHLAEKLGILVIEIGVTCTVASVLILIFLLLSGIYNEHK